MSLDDYIKQYYSGVKAKFARSQGVAPTQVSEWIRNGYIVVDHKLYSFRRDLNVDAIADEKDESS
ncbi:TPA: hypothetical protein NO555_005357 [Klebsiella variicola subsp. variicola]|nr:hypothetical protein [Klebsiella variicola subsp. variicola]HCI4627472.1 hypothetical protein [Klebsiella variicola subsp. variicola]HCI6660955.1 hypothetical protein [Klebsiella variicola subsp. variicola]